MHYETMRQFADTWGLVMLFAVFAAVVVFTMRPGSSETYKRLSRLPLDSEREQ